MYLLDMAEESHTQMKELWEQLQAHKQTVNTYREEMQKQVVELNRRNEEERNAEQACRHQEELKLIREEICVAIKGRDEEMWQELEAEVKKLKADMQHMQTD
ncbi:hypothetical protein FIBSPDRAFT_892171 [Athelia psychrophila]|uniref:Uncharacterized protein n=1 Tax=Athelia psychrophila TaxID=1759441 RepID=A0A166IVT4_9AGAM|nr:hypothetical protein FIBSPDRAFT_892171 [Fibularhizoctonia sp. CBS 109695]